MCQGISAASHRPAVKLLPQRVPQPQLKAAVYTGNWGVQAWMGLHPRRTLPGLVHYFRYGSKCYIIPPALLSSSMLCIWGVYNKHGIHLVWLDFVCFQLGVRSEINCSVTVPGTRKIEKNLSWRPRRFHLSHITRKSFLLIDSSQEETSGFRYTK